MEEVKTAVVRMCSSSTSLHIPNSEPLRAWQVSSESCRNKGTRSNLITGSFCKGRNGTGGCRLHEGHLKAKAPWK